MLTRLLLASWAAAAFAAGPVVRGQPRAEDAEPALRLPAVGEASLRILAPDLLELTQISTKRPDEAWPPLRPGRLRVMVAGRPAEVAATGGRRRVIYAPLARRDLRVATESYLRLARPIGGEGGTPLVEVCEEATAAGTPIRLAAASWDPRRTSPAIHVNQEGYVPSLPKQAMIGYYLGDLGELPIPEAAGFALIEARGGRTVYRGTLRRRRDVGYRTHPTPYQEVFTADFSDFTQSGEYRLEVPGLGVSLPFLVDEGIAMGFARTYALGLYHQRCGAANALPFTRFVHAACHTAPAQIPTPADPQFAFTWATIAAYGRVPSADETPQTAPPLIDAMSQLYPFVRQGVVDVSGGHHDAGDYSKYTINSAELIHYLVFAVDAIPGVAQLDNLGLPESGDGISDVLQEAKWEADYLAKLQDTDGGFYFLVYPRDREYESNVLPDQGDPQVVWPKNTASTAAAVAALAQCASSPEFRRHFPATAARYLGQARLGWRFLMTAIDHYGKAGAYQKITFYGDHFTHDDELAWAACELYLATGETAYRDQLFAWLPNPSDPATFRWGWWRMSESWGNAIRSYAFGARSGRLPAAALDARYLALCEGQVIAAAEDVLAWSGDDAYATPFPPATKAVLGAGWYFSIDQAADLAVAYQLDPKPAYLAALIGAMNYEAGCNPVNVTYLTGLGQHRQREIVDQYAQNDRRVLPSSGVPIGNLQAAFQYLPAYGFELRDATWPNDNAAIGPYPFYDRWSDAYNVTTEFITVNQGRSLLATAFLAARTAAAGRPWQSARAEIVGAVGTVALERPVTVRLEVPGEDLRGARTVWEARDQEPAIGASYTFSPKNNGVQWVEAELEWPDGRRAFAASTFTATSPIVDWIKGALPTGAIPAASGGDGWTWIAATRGSPSGDPVHQSGLEPGVHQHGFTGASATLEIGAGATLFAWVRLDPDHSPTELMLTWHDGASWEHRAYWGVNTITWGRSGSAGRYHAGSLPPAGAWVRLQVAAAAVGLEGALVSGMGFALVDGRASWATAGLDSAPPPPPGPAPTAAGAPAGPGK